MSGASIVGRYAPSPTGALHLGNLRTALAAWAFARSRGGRFLLRVEDLDRPRIVPGAEASQLADLRALGIDWDDEPLRQSERDAVYAEMLDRLRRTDAVFPCFCSRKELRTAASAPHAEERAPGYPGTCRSLDPQVVATRIAAHEQHCWRIRTQGAPAEFADGFAGTVPAPIDGDDFVVRRADGLFAYQLACAVDDALSAATEVLRGDDLLESGARQAWLLARLGLPVPAYFHIPLMLGPDGERLSKRRGSDDLAGIVARGSDPCAVRSYLAWTLGQCALGERLPADDLKARFDLRRVPREPVAFRPPDLAAFAR